MRIVVKTQSYLSGCVHADELHPAMEHIMKLYDESTATVPLQDIDKGEQHAKFREKRCNRQENIKTLIF